MTQPQAHRPPDTSSAPESGTNRDETSGNKPARRRRADTKKQGESPRPSPRQPADDPSSAPESGTNRE